MFELSDAITVLGKFGTIISCLSKVEVLARPSPELLDGQHVNLEKISQDLAEGVAESKILRSNLTASDKPFPKHCSSPIHQNSLG